VQLPNTYSPDKGFKRSKELHADSAKLQTSYFAALLAAEQETTRLPVRSALFKQRTGGLVVRWVTTGESPLLYVFAIFWKPRKEVEMMLCFLFLWTVRLPYRSWVVLKKFKSSCGDCQGHSNSNITSHQSQEK
jgi:hypothetical protein